MDNNTQLLIREALKVRMNAYAPYSHFAVGAALQDINGKIYVGCNVENAAYSPSNCAERSALFHAVSMGVRSFSRIAVVGGTQGQPPDRFCTPCGVCRQCLLEFCEPDSFEVIFARSETEYEVHTLAELMPFSFPQMT